MKTFNAVPEALDYSRNNPSETVECKLYHENGQLWEHCFYVDGEMYGEYKSYYSDGQLSDHLFCVDGKKHGECKTYYDNGQLDEHYFYVNGKLHGESKSYYDNGQLRSHYFYVSGEVFDVDHLRDGSYKSRCILSTLFNGNMCEDI